MIGFRSIEHQGHAAARMGKPDEANPYPHGSGPFYEYQNGCNAYRRGDVIDIRGAIINPVMAKKPIYDKGSAW